MNKCTNPTSVSRNGFSYNVPKNMDENDFYNILEEMINLCKIKGLTVMQAQTLFETCVDYVVDSTLV